MVGIQERGREERGPLEREKGVPRERGGAVRERGGCREREGEEEEGGVERGSGGAKRHRQVWGGGGDLAKYAPAQTRAQIFNAS